MCCYASTATPASAEAFLEQALGRSGQLPSAIITDHHQSYVKAIWRTVPRPCTSKRAPPGD